MSGSEGIVELSAAEPRSLIAAVHAVATEDERRARWLRTGAEQTVADEPADDETTRRFQALLEIGYLVASADGFAEAERSSLSRLLEDITGAAVDHERLELHFRDLDEAVATLGRRERLARAAADFEDAAGEEALELATLIALADGRLDQAERAVLVELGAHLGVSAERMKDLIDGVTRRVEAKLR